MDKIFVIKSVYMNIFIIYAALLLSESWPLTLFEYRYVQTLFVLMGVVLGVFNCFGLLSELIKKDSAERSQPTYILRVAKVSEYLLVAGFVLIVFTDILLKIVFNWMMWVFAFCYLQYIASHIYYLIIRQKVLLKY